MSRNPSSTITAAFVYASTNSLNQRSCSITYRISPPRKAMSVPARMGTNTSHRADVRLNRGSTWISVAPFSFAFSGQRNPTGCASAMFDPMTSRQSAFARSCW